MNYLFMLIGSLLGILIYALRKVKGIKKRMPENSFRAIFKEYIKTDWDSIAISLAAVVTAMFISSEYLNINSEDPAPITFSTLIQYKVANFIKTISVVLGYCANSIVDAYLGTTEAKLQKKAKEGGVDDTQS